jgi:hypothetical protein
MSTKSVDKSLPRNPSFTRISSAADAESPKVRNRDITSVIECGQLLLWQRDSDWSDGRA